MYQPYPTSGQPREPERRPPPQSVLNAVKLMYAGAALNAIGLVFSLAVVGGLKAAIKAHYPNFTAAQVHSAETGIITRAVVGALIAIGLWLWMAYANGRGHNWARIVSSVLFAVNSLDLVLAIALPHALIGLILGVAVWLVGLGTVVLIWSKESSPFYRQRQLA
jgi:hypothetical protein